MKRSQILKEALQGAKRIVITTHVLPDADGIGSEIALCLALRQLGLEVSCINEEELMERYQYLDFQNVVCGFKNVNQKKTTGIDLMIVVDANESGRIGKNMQKLLRESKRVLFIDHHPMPSTPEGKQCIDISMAATGQLVGELILALGLTLTPDMALALYTSILIDTSSFRYPTVTGSTHKLLAHLLETGIKPPNVYNRIYGAKKLSHMHFLGKVLESARSSQDEKIAWIIVRQDDIKKFDSNPEDTHGFINHLLILEKVKVACMFRDIASKVKVSFRSEGEIDVGELAKKLGGGGHGHSAATFIEGKLEEVIDHVIQTVEHYLKRYDI